MVPVRGVLAIKRLVVEPGTAYPEYLDSPPDSVCLDFIGVGLECAAVIQLDLVGLEYTPVLFRQRDVGAVHEAG